MIKQHCFELNYERLVHYMNKDDGKTKEKLIETVLQLLTEKSAHLLTIREIANKANVNSASISYYFGSKENLIEEASQFYWKQWDDMLKELEDNKQSGVERLKKYLYNYLNYILKYDGIFKSYIAKVISQSEYDSQAGKNIKKLSDIVKEIIRDITRIKDEQALKFKTIAILSAIAYPALLGTYGVSSLELNIYDDELKKKYIDELVESFFNLYNVEDLNE